MTQGSVLASPIPSAGQQDLSLVRGTTMTIDLVVVVGSSPYDLSGVTSAWATCKEAVLTSDLYALFQKTIGNGITITNAALGQMQVVIEPADTELLPISINNYNCYYDVKIKDATGEYVIASGNLNITFSVTQEV